MGILNDITNLALVATLGFMTYIMGKEHTLRKEEHKMRKMEFEYRMFSKELRQEQEGDDTTVIVNKNN